ncbi:hypothetical protein H0H81_002519 [Sphagnurus paluster]|uniref:DNA2/NAM7 helicase helicase domain-containing protein n=1 Tax=Sphagnurus paluster TaxID=117069 RepID=A0A9P7FM32_9AGAR|nr:hypothetical protein H0H81_002519 [Sphagnurus paluster]
MKRSSTSRVALLALAKVDLILVISVNVGDVPAGLLACDASFENIISGKGEYTLVGFDMPRILLRIAHDMGLSARGIDLSTAFVADTRKPSQISEVIAGRLFTGVDKAIVEGLSNDKEGAREVCLRAWLAVCVAQNNAQALEQVSRVDTALLNQQKVECLGELVRQAYALEDARPKETSSEFNRATLTKDGSLELLNSRYKTRVRRGPQVVIMTKEAGEEFSGQAHGAKGRTTNIKFTGQLLSGTLHKVRVIGSPQLTNPEKARDELVLHILQGIANLKAPFITKLWFPTKRIQDLLGTGASDALLFHDLNDSQKRVAAMMVSNAPLVIAHGPPGTGKTTTIAAAASKWDQCQQPTWIVAHSNVAVKNIAEALHKRNIDFKILVSKEFHFEWHEHIYTEIQQRVLRSDDFSGMKDNMGASSLIQGSHIILSTLSMLSNPGLDKAGVFREVPVEQLVIDEASQIKIEDFLPIFHKFRKTLQKVCFFGDPKQLPPYGKENVPEIKTIFDLPHLKGCGEFLDTQCAQ